MTITETLMRAFQLSSEEAAIFLSGFSKTHLKKNEIFIASGKVCNKIGLIEQGLMKCVFDKDGTDVVFEFAYENQFISDYYSFVTKTPSEKDIICLEDTTLYVIERSPLEELCRANSFLNNISRKTNEFLFLKMHNRIKSLMLETPAQRYQQLISEKQDLANRIPQYLLASYLNVKPETLSRIRKKLVPNQRS